MLGNLALKIYGILERRGYMDAVRQKLKRIYACTDSAARERCEKLYAGIIGRIILVLAVMLVIAAAVVVKSVMFPEVVSLHRQSYGGSVTDKSLEAVIDGETTDFEVEVMPMEYEEAELPQVFESAFAYIDECYLGENVSAEEVREPLNLVDYVDELGVSVEWRSDNYEVISSDGTVKNEDEDMDVLVRLTAVLSCGDMEAEQDYYVRVLGSRLDDTQEAIKLITDDIQSLQSENMDSQVIELPETIRGYKITDGRKNSACAAVIVLGLVAAGAIWAGGRSDIRRLEKKREQELLHAYPLLVDRITMYLSAGLTVRGALARIIQNEDDDSEEALTMEIRYTLNEIKSGVPESEAYYNMGHRTRLPVYIKLMSLLSQNVRKGTRDLLVMMAGEEQAAVQARKEMARKKGEEAGTRLLFPMIILLGVVMLIVILPAAIGF